MVLSFVKRKLKLYTSLLVIGWRSSSMFFLTILNTIIYLFTTKCKFYDVKKNYMSNYILLILWWHYQVHTWPYFFGGASLFFFLCIFEFYQRDVSLRRVKILIPGLLELYCFKNLLTATGCLFTLFSQGSH